MRSNRGAGLSLVAALVLGGCDYVVLPPEASGEVVSTAGWGAVATSVGPTDAGDLVVELTIRNDTGVWSAMEAAGPAVLTTGDGTTSDCATVKVGSGGHRLAPGLQMRGYQAGPEEDPDDGAHPRRVRRRDGRPRLEARHRLQLRDRRVQLLRPGRDEGRGDARGPARPARDGTRSTRSRSRSTAWSSRRTSR